MNEVTEMKNELLWGICLLVLIVGATMSLSSGQQGITAESEKGLIDQPNSILSTESSNIAGRISHNLFMSPSILKAAGSMGPEKILIYKTLPKGVTRENTLALAQKFNVTGNLRGETAFQSADLRYGIVITKNSGATEYQDFKRPNAQLDSPDKLPSDTEAVKIATRFLKERDLYPAGAADPTPVRQNAYTVGKGDEIYYGQIGVWYPRVLNNLKVEGTQLVVYVGGGGDVIGYYANWRDYVPDKEYPVIPPFEAFEKMKKNGVSVGMNNTDELVSIDEVSLVYQTAPGSENEEYLNPVWVFRGNLTAEEKPVVSVEEFISALTDESIKSLSF